MSLALLLTSLFGFAALLVPVLSFQRWQFLIAGPLAFVLFMGGYSIRTECFLRIPDPRTSPQITRPSGKPETYNPIGWINQFREFDEQKIAFVPYLIRPLFAFSLRGDSMTRFCLSFLDDSLTPEAAAIMALNDGCSKLVVSEVFLTVSNRTAEGKDQIRELNLEEKYGVPVRFTGPLYDSDSLKRMFLVRADANCAGVDKSQLGVLLVGHGQPEEWDREWATETEQEIGFRNGVLELLAANGYPRENLGLAWMEFKQPHPAPKIEEFVKRGVKRVLYFSAAISADAMHSQYDVPKLVSHARVPAGTALVNLRAWNDDPLVIQGIREKIDAQLQVAGNPDVGAAR